MRPKTLFASLAPILLAAAAIRTFNPEELLSYIFCFLMAILMQIGTNMTNDYVDCLKGVDGEGRIGPDRMAATGQLKIHQIRNAAYICFAISFVIGLYFVWKLGIIPLIVGLTCILLAYAYTGGPIPLSYIGLGEILAFIFFGPVCVGFTYYAVKGILDPDVFYIGAIPGAMAAAIMATNNLRDIESDKESKKYTMAVVLGPTFQRVFITFSLVFAFGLGLILFYLSSGLVAIYPLAILILPIRHTLKIIWDKKAKSRLNLALRNILIINFAICTIALFFMT